MPSLLFSFKAAVVIAGLVVSTAAQAQGYLAENRLRVMPLTQTSFEVIEARGEGPRGIWCAAAGYARDRLGAARGARLYVMTARGASRTVAGAKAVGFTIRTADLPVPATQSTSVSVRVPGQGLPVHHARQFCKDYFIELEDRF